MILNHQIQVSNISRPKIYKLSFELIFKILFNWWLKIFFLFTPSISFNNDLCLYFFEMFKKDLTGLKTIATVA